MGGRFENLKIRSLVIGFTREFFIQEGYLEVETPVMGPAVIPEAHIDPVTAGGSGGGLGYLQASPELCMKRLLSRGLPKIFQICKCFRKNERGERHLPELTMLEWYAAHETYHDLMTQCENLFRFIAKRLGRGTTLEYQGKSIDLSPEFKRISVSRAFEDYTDVTMARAIETDRFDELMGFNIEPGLGLDRPCILYDYPACFASLAMLRQDCPDLAQRFELYVAGIELANGFTELTDSKTLRQRFIKENQIRQDRGMESLPIPEKFLQDLSAMPPAAGIALGLDRLAMLFCNAGAIDDVVAFTPEQL